MDGIEQKCGNCKYCDHCNCRKHAPIAGHCSHNDKIFPRISPYFDWCGDWEVNITLVKEV